MCNLRFSRTAVVLVSGLLYFSSFGVAERPEWNQPEERRYMTEHRLFLRSPKKILREETFKQWEREKREIIPVIINLNISSEDKGTDIPASMPLNERIFTQQDQILNMLLKNKNVNILWIFENSPSIYCEIPANLLKPLSMNPNVDSIGADDKLEFFTAQGIPLIGGDVFRSEYTGQGISIAIVDTGIDWNHPFLGAGNYGGENQKIKGGSDFTNSVPAGWPQGDWPYDLHGHGTACAGIAAGDLGFVGDYQGGVAHNAKLYALKIDFSTFGNAMSAIDWIISRKQIDGSLRVISMSFGTVNNFFENNCDDNNTDFFNILNSARNNGITAVAASGNCGNTNAISLPACFSNVISVGAVYDDHFQDGGMVQTCLPNGHCFEVANADMVTCFSNSSPILDVLAPSHNAYTTWLHDGTGNFDDDPIGYRSTFGGTSAACPYVAGAVAVIQEASLDMTGRYRSPNEIRNILTSTGDPIVDHRPGANNRSRPRINIAKAIQSMMHKITPTSGSNGTISPSGDVYVKPGGSKTFSASPNSGYEVDSWVVYYHTSGNTSTIQTGGNTCTISSVTQDMTLTVYFKQISGPPPFGDLEVIRPASSPYETGEYWPTFEFRVPDGTSRVAWHNTTINHTGNITYNNQRWQGSVYVENGQNNLNFTAYNANNNALAATSFVVIKIDNMRTIYVSGSNADWAYYWQGNPGSHYSDSGIFIGWTYSSSSGKYGWEEAVVRFNIPALPARVSGGVLESNFRARVRDFASEGAGSFDITAAAIHPNWQFDVSNVTWNSRPGWDGGYAWITGTNQRHLF